MSPLFTRGLQKRFVSHLEEGSCLKFNKDFFVGYSPERINPGDSASFDFYKKSDCRIGSKTRHFVDNLYSSIISAGTHSASSIKVAEVQKL